MSILTSSSVHGVDMEEKLHEPSGSSHMSAMFMRSMSFCPTREHDVMPMNVTFTVEDGFLNGMLPAFNVTRCPLAPVCVVTCMRPYTLPYVPS